MNKPNPISLHGLLASFDDYSTYEWSEKKEIPADIMNQLAASAKFWPLLTNFRKATNDETDRVHDMHLLAYLFKRPDLILLTGQFCVPDIKNWTITRFEMMIEFKEPTEKPVEKLLSFAEYSPVIRWLRIVKKPIVHYSRLYEVLTQSRRIFDEYEEKSDRALKEINKLREIIRLKEILADKTDNECVNKIKSLPKETAKLKEECEEESNLALRETIMLKYYFDGKIDEDNLNLIRGLPKETPKLKEVITRMKATINEAKEVILTRVGKTNGESESKIFHYVEEIINFREMQLRLIDFQPIDSDILSALRATLGPAEKKMEGEERKGEEATKDEKYGEEKIEGKISE